MLNGIKGLLASKKGTLCLIILVASTAALFTKHLDSASFAAIVATISAIYQYTTHKIDLATLNPNPPTDPAMGNSNAK